MISFDDFATEKEYQEFLEGLYKRVQNGENLSLDEQNFMCKCMTYEHQKSLSICDDLRFKRLYLKSFDSKQKNYELEEFEEEDLKSFLDEWKKEMKKENHKDGFMNLIAKETRLELKKIFPNFELLNKIFRHKKYRAEQYEIIGYSKFAFIKIKSVFAEIGDNKIETELNGNKIEIDEYSLIHIYFRHYAQLVKPYNTDDKSYFTPEILVEEVPTILDKIIKDIDASGLYVNDDFNNLNFKFKNRDYKVYCRKATKQIKGVGNVKVNRVNTFYPIELKEDKDKLKNYNLVKVNDDLSVYAKKENGS